MLDEAIVSADNRMLAVHCHSLAREKAAGTLHGSMLPSVDGASAITSANNNSLSLLHVATLHIHFFKNVLQRI